MESAVLALPGKKINYTKICNPLNLLVSHFLYPLGLDSAFLEQCGKRSAEGWLEMKADRAAMPSRREAGLAGCGPEVGDRPCGAVAVGRAWARSPHVQ